MAKFRQVYTEFWTDAKVIEEMTPEDKYFYLYLLTNPYTKQIGVYQITKKQMAFDMGYSIESINSLMDRFIHQHKLIKYNPETREIAILNWGKYNLRRGGKPMRDLIFVELDGVKDSTLIQNVVESIVSNSTRQIFEEWLNINIYKHSDFKNTIRGQEEEEEEEKEEEREEEQEKENVVVEPENPFLFYENNFGMLSPFISENIQDWILEFNDSIVVESMKIALKKNKPFSYAEAILKNWKQKNVKTLSDIHALNKAFENERKGDTKVEIGESSYWQDR